MTWSRSAAVGAAVTLLLACGEILGVRERPVRGVASDASADSAAPVPRCEGCSFSDDFEGDAGVGAKWQGPGGSSNPIAIGGVRIGQSPPGRDSPNSLSLEIDAGKTSSTVGLLHQMTLTTPASYDGVLLSFDLLLERVALFDQSTAVDAGTAGTAGLFVRLGPEPVTTFGGIGIALTNDAFYAALSTDVFGDRHATMPALITGAEVPRLVGTSIWTTWKVYVGPRARAIGLGVTTCPDGAGDVGAVLSVSSVCVALPADLAKSGWDRPVVFLGTSLRTGNFAIRIDNVEATIFERGG